MTGGDAFIMREVHRPDRLAAKLQVLALANEKGLKKTTLLAAKALRKDIVKGIKNGTRSGRLYTWMVDIPGDKGQARMMFPNGRLLPIKQRNKPHRASAEGEFPKADSGIYMNSIMFNGGDFYSQVGTDQRLGLWLEKGTKFMGPRPHFKPSADEFMPKFSRMLDKFVEENLK